MKNVRNLNVWARNGFQCGLHKQNCMFHTLTKILLTLNLQKEMKQARQCLLSEKEDGYEWHRM